MIAYRLLENITTMKHGSTKELLAKLEEANQANDGQASREEILSIIENYEYVLAEKGEIFYRSNYWTHGGKGCLYSKKLAVPEILKKTDVSLGLGLFYKDDKLELWIDHLRWFQERYENWNFEEFETDELSFEQIYVVAELEKRIKEIDDKISNLSESKLTMLSVIDKILINN